MRAWMIALTLAMTACHKAQAPPQFGPGSESYRLEALAQSWRSKQLDGATVFLGDSLTAGLATSTIVDRSENFGIGGDTVDGLAERVRTYDLSRAGLIVVTIGTNDEQLHRLGSFGAGFEKLLAALPQRPMLASSIPPAHHNDPHARAANAAIRTLCEKRKGCIYFDASADLADEHGQLRREFDAGDGVHLSTEGYKVWRDALKRAIPVASMRD